MSAAKSLKCNECGSLFLSVREAQAHGELTKHASFSETTEAVRLSICAACGKPARSAADKKLHERHTGHSDWAEHADGAAALGLAAGGGGAALDTEAQMRAAKAELEADAEADAELLGISRKKKKAAEAAGQAGGGGGKGGDAAGGSAAAGGASADAKTEGGAGAAQEGGGGGEGGSAPNEDGDELVPVSVDRAALGELRAMGFGEHRAARALHATGNAGVEAAVGWLADREGAETDADTGAPLDAPLLLARRDAAARGGARSAMSAEEARRKAGEMMARAKERREREEREAAARRERDRVRAGKELQAALRLEEEGRFKRVADERRREREEAERARAALRAKLEEDKRERRRRLGLPEEPTDEERAAEAERRRAKEAEEADRRAAGPPQPSASAAALKRLHEQLRDVLVSMKKGAPEGEAQFKTAAATLRAYVTNLGQASPGSEQEAKFRRINRANAAYRARVGCLPQAGEFLAAVGFVAVAAAARDVGGGGGGGGGGDFLEAPLPVDRARLSAAAAALDDALTNPFFGVL